MKKYTILSNDFDLIDKAEIGQFWTKNDKRYYIVYEGDDIEISDEYHTMHELYQHRMALNIALFNLIEQVRHWESAADTLFDNDYKVVKSKLHHDGTMFEGYFIVMALCDVGQISYHYDLKYWDNFQIPQVERIPVPYDGHTSNDVIERLMKL